MQIHAESNSNKRKAEEELSFDPEPLLASILTEVGTPTNIAEGIVWANPDILSTLCHYRKQDLIQIFQKATSSHSEDQRKQVKGVVTHLSTLSIRNSRYTGVTEDLDKQIGEYLKLSQKEPLQGLVQEAKAVLDQATFGNVAKICEKINQTLQLFSYLDCAEEIKCIYQNTVDFGKSPVFQNCKKHFPELCKNLKAREKEGQELRQLLKLLAERHRALAPRPSAPPSISLPPERERFFQRHTALLWQAGADFLEKLFKKSFPSTENGDRFLPVPFCLAVNRAALSHPEWHAFTAKQLACDPKKIASPPAFVSPVWIYYLGEESGIDDLGDFLRHILRAMPESIFQKIKETPSRMIEESLPQIFSFMALKRWFEKTKNPS